MIMAQVVCLSLLDLVKLFIKAGYDVNRSNWYGCESPLESTLHSKDSKRIIIQWNNNS